MNPPKHDSPGGLRTLLETAVGAEPPLGIQPDRVVAAGQRRLLRRRLTMAGSGLAVVGVAAASAVALPGGSDRDRGLQVGSPHPTPPRATAPATLPPSAPATPQPRVPLPQATDWPAPPPVPKFRSADDPAQQRIAARLSTVLRRALPARFASPRLAFRVSQGGFKAAADVTDALGTGNVFVTVYDLLGPPTGEACTPPTGVPAAGTPAGTVQCTSGPDGAIIAIRRQPAANGVVYVSVSAYRRDGVQVSLDQANYSEARNPPTKNGPAPRAERATMPLTEAEAIRLVIDPALTPYPPTQR